MSPSELNDFADGLVTEMAEAGRAARALDAGADAPKAAFTMQLEGELRLGWSNTATEVEPHDRPASLGRLPSRRAAGRWAVVGLAASLAVASLIFGVGGIFPTHVSATATDAVAATLVRAGVAEALQPGTELREGDEIKVAAGGRATLELGGRYARMDGGADLRVASTDVNHIAVDQLSGRVYHRAVAGSGGDYEVTTANVTWTARAAAFDLDRHVDATGADQVVGLALYDGVALAAPSFAEELAQGQSATVALAASGAEQPAVESIEFAAMLEDYWLAGNVTLDSRLGLPIGPLASFMAAIHTGLASAATTSAPSPRPTEIAGGPTPSASPSAVFTTPAGPTVRPAPSATPRVTAPPAPTAAPPTAGPIADLGTLGEADNLDHTFTFTWSAYTGGAFSGYVLVYETTASGKVPSYTDGSPVWATPGPAATSVNIPWPAPGSYQIRIQAIATVAGKTVVLSQTAVNHAHLSGSASPSP